MHYSLKNISKLGAAVLAMMSLAPQADARLEKTLPKETYGVAQVADIADLQSRLATHPAKDIWLKLTDPNGYFGPAIKELRSEAAKDKNFNLKDFEKLVDFLKTNVNGELLLAVTKIKPKEKGWDAPVGIIFVADFAATEKEVEAYITKLTKDDKNVNSTTSTYQGITLHEYKRSSSRPPHLGWAVANKTFVLAPAQELRDVVDAILNGRKNSIADTAIWKRSAAAAGKNDFFAFINTPLLTAELRAFVVKQNPKDKDEAPNPLEPDPIHAYDTLALDAVDEIWATYKLTADGLSAKSSLAYKEKRGLLTLLTLKPLETFVPNYISSNQAGFATAGIDLNQAWKNVETLFQTALPAIKPLFDMQISKLKKDEGLDLRGALFDNFGENLTQVYSISAPKTKGKKSRSIGTLGLDGLYVIGFRDTAKLDALIRTALSKAGHKDAEEALFQIKDFMGVKINRLKESDEISFSYALFDGKLFLAIGEGVLENAIAEFKSPQKPLSKSPYIQQILRKVPKDASFFTYSDLGNTLAGYFGIFEAILAVEGKTSKVIDISKRPKAEDIPWVSYGYATERGNEIISEVYVLPKK
jgi:hypothetical protein